MNSAFLKAVGIGVGVFAVVMLVFWIISRAAGVPFLEVPRRPTRVPQATPAATPPAFLR